jgi:polysaccharide export outer membrane protein
MAMNLFLSFVLTAVAAVQPAAQTPSQNPAPGPSSADGVAAAATQTPVAASNRRVAPDYTIGTNDSLAITVFGEDALTNKYTVNESGMVTFPLVGAVQAGGKTIAKFQDDLTKMLANGYLINPQVRVDVDTYKSQYIFVSGAVRQPQRVAMTGQMTLTEALAQAGSPTSDAGDDVQVAHRSTKAPDEPLGPDDEARHFSLQALVLGRGDIQLQDGDRIYVPLAQHFTITGQIKNSGSYIWEKGMTAERAIALAGGLTERGKTGGMSAHRMVNGKMKDVSLRPGDQIQAGDVITVKQRIF